MEAREVKALFRSLKTMPEHKNPELFKRTMRLRERIHEVIQTQIREERYLFPTVGADLLPSECHYCYVESPYCRPDELCIGHELLSILEERKKTLGSTERPEVT